VPDRRSLLFVYNASILSKVLLSPSALVAHLEHIGQKYFYSKIEKYSTSVKLVSSKQTFLNDGTPSVEILLDSAANEYWSIKTLILSTYRGDKLIFAAIKSLAHPEALRDYLYSLRFD
jgi:hypothetical protein